MPTNKLCKNGHVIGTNADCRACQISNYIKKKWQNRTPAMVKALAERHKQLNIDGLNSDIAVQKRAAYFSSEEHKQKASIQAKKLAADRRCGLRPPCIGKKSNTKPELAVRAYLESRQITFLQQAPIGPYLFDFYIPDLKVLVEVQGEYWHAQPHNIANDLSKASYVESQLSDHRVVYITEVQTRSFGGIESAFRHVFDVVPELVDVTLANLNVRPIDDADVCRILAAAHYLPRLRKTNRVAHGIFHGDKLVGAIAYGLPTYAGVSAQYGLKPRNVLELVRFAILPGYNIPNMFSFTLGKSIKMIKHDSDFKDVCLLVSFADPHFGHSGKAYLAANWVFDGDTEPSYYYINGSGDIIHKRTLWDHAQKMGMSEREYAISNGFVRINTQPKKKFIYQLRKFKITKPSVRQTIDAVCVGPCGKKFMVTKSAYCRALKRNIDGYVCQPCSLKLKWQDNEYRNNVLEGRKHGSNNPKLVESKCLDCPKIGTISAAAYKRAMKKYGGYVCHGCSMIRHVRR